MPISSMRARSSERDSRRSAAARSTTQRPAGLRPPPRNVGVGFRRCASDAAETTAQSVRNPSEACRPFADVWGEGFMDKIWLKHYPKGVPAEIDINEYASLRDVFDASV